MLRHIKLNCKSSYNSVFIIIDCGAIWRHGPATYVGDAKLFVGSTRAEQMSVYGFNRLFHIKTISGSRKLIIPLLLNLLIPFTNF